MKKIIFSFIACLFIGTICAQPQYSPKAQIHKNQISLKAQRAKGSSQEWYIPATLQASDIDELEEYGIIVGTQAGGYTTALIPASRFSSLDEIKSISYIDAGNYAHTLLDVALPDIGYQQILQTPHTSHYLGKGVIVGIVDIGFQWDHIAFCNPDGSTRILAAWNQNDTTGTAPEPYSYGSLYDTQEELFAAAPCPSEIHGTHVASIAAGSAFNEIAYGGVARQASLVLVDALHTDYGSIYNEGIVDGIKFIFDYAEKCNMPCVINLSIGGNMGPHDGTSPFDIMCDSLQGAGRLIVGAMGNSGNEYYHLGHDFDTQEKEVRAGLRQYGSALPELDGWSKEPVQYGIELYHGRTDTVLDWTGWIPMDSLFEYSLQYFDREVLIEASTQLYPENNCYNTHIVASGINNLGNAYFALRMKGESGKVNVWCNTPGTEFSTRGFEGWLGGDTEMTLNEIGGTGKRITSVGSYTSDTLKNTTKVFEVEYELHAVSPFSSRGYTADGRMKPEICAPGSLITAAFNDSLVADTQNYFNGKVENTYDIGGKTYYYGANSGTSMAAPVVTGTYALWLQAEPSLTPEQAKEILKLTATQDSYTTDPAGSGYGKINPYAGLYYILEANNISAPQQDNGVTLYPTIGNGEFNIVSPEYSSDMTISIYTSSGICLSTTTLQEEQLGTPVEWLIPGSQQGVYYINICTNRGSKTYKFVKL